MFLIRGKHKLAALVTVVTICAVGSILFYYFLRKPDNNKPPTQLIINEPTGQQAESQPNQSKVAENPVTPIVKPTKIVTPTETAKQDQSGPYLASGEYYAQAQGYQKHGENSKAVESYAAALKADPYQCVFYQEKAQLEFRMGKKDEAIATLQDGLRYCPDDQMMQGLLNNYRLSR